MIRTFRFLACFSAAQALYAGGATTPLSLESWLDVTKLTLLGLYGLLETVTIPDMAGVEVFGGEADRRINLEAQRFWFLALVCGVVGGLLRILTLEAHGAMPATGVGYAAAGADDEDTKGEKVVREGEKDELKAEMEKAAEGKKGPKAGKAAVAEEERRKSGEQRRALVRKVAADAVDMVLPVSVLGWADVDPAVVGLAMFVSTLVSGYDVWKGLGAQMRANGAKA